MKRTIALAMVVGLLLTSAVWAAPDSTTAGLLSAMMPGAGEWYNSNYRGPFPWGECIIGSIPICFPIHLSSVFDAVSGKTDTNLRIDFWTAPSN